MKRGKEISDKLLIFSKEPQGKQLYEECLRIPSDLFRKIPPGKQAYVKYQTAGGGFLGYTLEDVP